MRKAGKMAATTATSLMHLIMEKFEKWMMEFYCGKTSEAHGFASFQKMALEEGSVYLPNFHLPNLILCI